MNTMDRCLSRAWSGVLFSALLWLVGCQSAPQFKPALDDDPIKPGDVLLVTCSSNSEPFALRWVVDSTGAVHVPYSGDWRVAGKRPSQAAQELSQYFSVRRTVTFKVEKIDAELNHPTPPKSPVVDEKKRVVLTSPKGS